MEIVTIVRWTANFVFVIATTYSDRYQKTTCVFNRCFSETKLSWSVTSAAHKPGSKPQGCSWKFICGHTSNQNARIYYIMKKSSLRDKSRFTFRCRIYGYLFCWSTIQVTLMMYWACVWLHCIGMIYVGCVYQISIFLLKIVASDLNIVCQWEWRNTMPCNKLPF